MASSNGTDGIRTGSSPNFCPPAKEGITLEFTDDNNDKVLLEFLGILLLDDKQYGFFFPIDDKNPALSSGEIVILEVTGFDDEGEPEEFELVVDEDVLRHAYQEFTVATKDLYRFE